jgi:hypothetical protein
VKTDPLARVAALLHERNAIDAELARLTQRPMTSGHLGEWIAAQVFGGETSTSRRWPTRARPSRRLRWPIPATPLGALAGEPAAES